MQEQYQRLIKNLSPYPEPIRSQLIKSVSATKTAIDALDSRIAADTVSDAVKGFMGVLTALNDVLEEIATAPTSPAGVKDEPEFDPVPAKPKKSAKNNAIDPESVSVERDSE
jgi:hypothetical protein